MKQVPSPITLTTVKTENQALNKVLNRRFSKAGMGVFVIAFLGLLDLGCNNKNPPSGPVLSSTVVQAKEPSVSSNAQPNLLLGSDDALALLSAEEQSFVNKINEFREKNGLTALKVNLALQKAAHQHSNYMHAQSTLTHAEPAPNDSSSVRITNAGGKFGWTAENVACGHASAADTLDQWINSAGHRANMLNPRYQFLGIARAGSENDPTDSLCYYQFYWTLDLAGD